MMLLRHKEVSEHEGVAVLLAESGTPSSMRFRSRTGCYCHIYTRQPHFPMAANPL
jgi:hypothetical protein